MRCSRLLLMAVICFSGRMGSAFDPAQDVAVSFAAGSVVIQAPKGVHLKKSLTSVELASKPGAISIQKLPPATDKDELGEDIWRGSVRIPLTAEGLGDPATLEVTYQPCVEGEGGACYPPTTQTLTVPRQAFLVAPAPGKAERNKPATDQEPRSATIQAPPLPGPSRAATPGPVPPAPMARGTLSLLLLAFLAGLGASLTPCVYPMIPITMAVIGGKAGPGTGKGRGFRQSLALVLGMAVTYTTLGVLAARAGAAFGAFAQRPAFLVPVSLLFTLFALSLFGAFELQLPAAVQNRLQGGGARKGFGGAFLMGLVLGPLAAPCVGPVVGSVLVGIAQKGDVFLGGLQLFVFSLGMGVLFLLAGTFSAALPRSGAWLIRLKHGMGVVVLAFAAWNVRLLGPDWLHLALAMGVVLVAAAVLGPFEQGLDLIGQVRRGAAVLLLGLGLVLGLRAMESGLGLRLLGGAPAQATPAPAGPWLAQDLEGALRRARSEHKLVLVDIYAEWCAQCKELDERTWPDPAVRAWIDRNAVAVRIDTDKQRPDLAATLQIRSYPSVLLLDADGRELARSLGFHNPAAMLGFLAATHQN
jgi:thiol:disulfide interchange protein DsbD